MRPLIIAAAALGIFALAIAMIASGAAPAPAVPAADRCMLCHPQAHADGWMRSHAADLLGGSDSMTTCSDCHDSAYCDDCHARVPGLAGGGSAGGSAGAGAGTGAPGTGGAAKP